MGVWLRRVLRGDVVLDVNGNRQLALDDPDGGAFWAGVRKVSNDKAPTFYVLSAKGYSKTVWAHYHITGTWK